MKRICTLLLLAAISLGAYAQRTETLLRDWTFNGKEQVRIPHDWAITGPFDRSIDLQVVAILQNGETEASEKTARSGGLPWIGKGFYECTVDLDKTPGTKCTLLFDGAMSNARVYVNGAFAGEWPYGYNSFYFDVTEFVKAGSNAIRVELENLPGSSRWYPGAGLYRNVHLIQTAETRVPVWGTQITTPEVSPDKALVSVRTEVEGPLAGVTVRTEIVRDGQVLAQSAEIPAAALLEQQLELEHPALWSPETPNLYTAVTILRKDQQEIDRYETVFGVRSISVTAEGGFKLNGQRRQIKGVCLHHDLGPLGAAVNESAIRRQLGILKDMGCDAIRTSHNMPAPELVRLCNELGFMMMLEPFDEWDIAKCENGYHRLFDAWAERDMVNMLRDNELDLCVSFLPGSDPGLDTVVLSEDEIVLATTINNREYVSGITLGELWDQTLFYSECFSISRELNRWRSAVLPDNLSFRVTMPVIYQLGTVLERTDGYAFVPRSYTREQLEHHTLHTIPLLFEAPPPIYTYAAAKKSQMQSYRIRAFLTELRNHICGKPHAT